MNMYAIKNDKGEYAHIDMDDLTWETGFATLWFGINEPYAKRTADDYGGHVVELIEAPAKVVVSEEEAEMLKNALWPATAIANFSAGKPVNTDMNALEDRLMRAYANGWTVEKPRRFNVKVPHAEGYWYYRRENYKLATVNDHAYADDFTDAEIEHYGLGDCEKVRV